MKTHVFAAVLALAGLAALPAQAQAELPNSNVDLGCDRACLYKHADAYLDALNDKDPSRLPWADHVVFTENNVQLEIGDGLWGTVSAVRDSYDLKMADPRNGEVGWFGIVEESGHAAIMALRLKVKGGKIAQAETILARRVDNSPFPSIETYIEPRQVLLDDVPEDKRLPRARLLSIADGYFDTLQLNDGQILTSFDEECERIENGLQTTHNVEAFPDYAIAAYGCEGQFLKGQYKYDDRLRDRRFPLVDEEKGLVLAGGFIDHSGRLVDFTWTDGTPVKSMFHFPHSYVLLEVFKIEDGKIRAVEAVFTDVPYNMPTVWPVPGK